MYFANNRCIDHYMYTPRYETVHSGIISEIFQHYNEREGRMKLTIVST